MGANPMGHYEDKAPLVYLHAREGKEAYIAMRIERRSPFSGRILVKDLKITVEQLLAWKAGVLIQDAMPQLSPEDREFVMTGTTQEEWDLVFGEGGK